MEQRYYSKANVRKEILQQGQVGTEILQRYYRKANVGKNIIQQVQRWKEDNTASPTMEQGYYSKANVGTTEMLQQGQRWNRDVTARPGLEQGVYADGEQCTYNPEGTERSVD